MLRYGARMDYKIPHAEMDMAMYALHRGNANMLDILLEHGASMDYRINGRAVDNKLKWSSPKIARTHLKHERWRHIRKFLSLEEQVGQGTTKQ